MERRVHLRPDQPNSSEHGKASSSSNDCNGKENCRPSSAEAEQASMGVKNTLRPTTLDNPSHFYPAGEQHLASKGCYRPPLQAADIPPLEPPWEIGGVLGPWEHRKGVRWLSLSLSGALGNTYWVLLGNHRCCTGW